jgi:hypothetical protein
MTVDPRWDRGGIRVVFDALAQGLAVAGDEGGDMATVPGG